MIITIDLLLVYGFFLALGFCALLYFVLFFVYDYFRDKTPVRNHAKKLLELLEDESYWNIQSSFCLLANKNKNIYISFKIKKNKPIAITHIQIGNNENRETVEQDSIYSILNKIEYNLIWSKAKMLINKKFARELNDRIKQRIDKLNNLLEIA